ncbi:TIGR03618 family F420-dependent PPOX class oxidoreductase [Actinoplanes nipponensis]|uniref:TIGR03618 family F420-dependent PPOX class oxidoreductase n=1 Tax=Actinoplanes nipponensis TaxID=135950 RepID=UPI0027DB168C|nr:TIGR03618 family F420-dependent PPOX class oxidoreductase [Actinoplanes nipponensis]
MDGAVPREGGGGTIDTLTAAWALAAQDSGLAVVATLRADATIQSSLVNTGIVDHPATGGPVLAFVTYGRVKLANLRVRPQVTTTFRTGWRWAAVEGRAELAGPDDPRSWLDAEGLRLLLRGIFTAAGGSHDDWAEYDRVMAEQRRTAVLITPDRIYGS